MLAFIEASHRRGQGVGELAVIQQQQLAETLVGKPVAANAAIAPALCPDPSHGGRGICRFLTEAQEVALRAAASAHVLNDHRIAVAGVPLRMGVGHG